MGFQYGVKCIPYRDEPEAGDGFYISELENGLFVTIIDVLGHGVKAAALARQLEKQLEEIASADIDWTMRQAHQYLLGTIGAAMTIVFFDVEERKGYGLGVGNTLIRQLGENGGSYQAQAGIVGELLPNLKHFEFNFEGEDTFLFTTDGVKENISNSELEDANGKAVEYLSSYFIHSFSKPFDDATVIVVRFSDD
ncbi:SpoIIE family protein phosphatase [Vibrio bivalvicida]|uniref:Serine/threonine protein phosphatase n=1 Tax=Vibrio bivalvicida TaxID=1276888 RepID=A0A177XW33_9VIBR|nr:SpoIIE family protein phosphatase [Vibrio bivalvicida]OAJ92769.1 serine/threonine protein phosphatase [Vibrio bivalvicida]